MRDRKESLTDSISHEAQPRALSYARTSGGLNGERTMPFVSATSMINL